MPDTGSPWFLPYPSSTDDVRPYEDIETLATTLAAALTASLVTNMAPVTSGIDSTLRSTTSTAYTTTLTAAAIWGVAFTAPASGKVLLNWRCTLNNSGSQFSGCAPQVAAGAVVGSGAAFLSASDTRSVGTEGSVFETQGGSATVTGLTPGNAYNVALYHRVVGGTQLVSGREVMVIPLLA